MTVDEITIARDPSSSSPESTARRGARTVLGRFVRHRLGVSPPWLLLVELFLAIGWLRAGTEKLMDSAWWSGQELVGFLAATSDGSLPWYEWFVDELVAAHLVLIATSVLLVELTIGVLLFVGRRVAVAHLVGMGLVLNFLAAGAVNPSIFYLVLHAVALLWLVERRSPKVVMLEMTRVVAAAVALASVPFITSVEPARLVEDAAAVLAMFGVLVVVTSSAAIGQMRHEPV